ncbi:hypothetical protein EJB05_13248, partial [Eragrostis curvula]
SKSYRPVENNKIVTFLPTSTLKNLKDSDDIPRYNVIGVASYIGPVKEMKKQFGLSKIRVIFLLI